MTPPVFNGRFAYSFATNAILLAARGLGFEEIIKAIGEGNLLGIAEHPNAVKYPGQQILYVRILDEAYVVPFILQPDGTAYLKTLFPSRKAPTSLL